MERYRRSGQYTNNFGTLSDPKIACSCCGSLGPSMPKVLLQIAQEAREYFGVTIEASSGYRCPVYNKAVGGGEFSTHMAAEGLDLKCPDEVEYEDFYQFFYDDKRVRGLGKYTREKFVHIDVATRSPRDVWGD